MENGQLLKRKQLLILVTESDQFKRSKTDTLKNDNSEVYKYSGDIIPTNSTNINEILAFVKNKTKEVLDSYSEAVIKINK
jgi:hypothetical protein